MQLLLPLHSLRRAVHGPCSSDRRRTAVRCPAVETADRVDQIVGVNATALTAALGNEVSTEVPFLTELKVEGQLPTWLKGDLYRTGPGSYDQMTHFADGFAMTVHFKFDQGRVFWNQRFVQSDAFKAWQQTGKPVFNEAGYRTSMLNATIHLLKYATGLGGGVASTDNASVSVLPSAVNDGELIAATETLCGTLRIDSDSLATLGRVTYRDSVPGNITTAHPGGLGNDWSINVAYSFPTSDLSVYRYRVGDTKRELLYSLKPSNGRLSWIHDLAVSSNYLALVEMPVYMNLLEFMQLAKAEYGFVDFVPENGTTVRLVRVDGSGVAKEFRLPPFFCYHFVNTFEKDVPGLGPCVIIDAALGKNPQTIVDTYLETMRDRNSNVANLEFKRIILPLEGPDRHFMEDLIADHSSYGNHGEMPSIHPMHRQQDYRYMFCGTISRPSPIINQVSKMDVQFKRVVAHWRPEGGGFPLCEPKFVARPGGVAEDDGVVLALSINGMGRCFVAVLDARDLREVARCYTTEAVKLGFHSTFVHAA